MEFIRNRFDHLASFLRSQQAKLEHYLKTFPETQSEAVEATDRFVQDINEVITYIASSISQSCKNGSSSGTANDRLQYSPDQVSKVCKIKAKMQQIRYAFLCPSSKRSTEITDIQVLFDEALELCSNQLVYTHFKGATKGRCFDIDDPQRPNPIETQEQGEGSKLARLKMKDSKMILYEEVSRHLHAEQQKKRKQEQSRAISPIKPHNTSNTANVHLQSRQKIFSGQVRQCHPHRKNVRNSISETRPNVSSPTPIPRKQANKPTPFPRANTPKALKRPGHNDNNNPWKSQNFNWAKTKILRFQLPNKPNSHMKATPKSQQTLLPSQKRGFE